ASRPWSGECTPRSPRGGGPTLSLVLLLAATAQAPRYPALATDAGFAPDAGERGLIIDTSAADAGRPTEHELAPQLFLHVTGAKALPREVYFDAIHLPPDAVANEDAARSVREQAMDYLLRTGFELATANARVTSRGIELEVNEGQVERVLFLGQLSFNQI